MEATSPKYTRNLLGRAFRHCSQWGSLQSGLLYYYQLLALILLGSTEQAVCSTILRRLRSVMAAYSADLLPRIWSTNNITQTYFGMANQPSRDSRIPWTDFWGAGHGHSHRYLRSVPLVLRRSGL